MDIFLVHSSSSLTSYGFGGKPYVANSEMLSFYYTMWYNINIPKSNLMKGGIFMPKGNPNKKYTPDFKIMVVERMQNEGINISITRKCSKIKA